MSTTHKQLSLEQLLKQRRTIHNFKPELPPDDLIEQALDLARWVPNHKKTEPWRFYWIGPETSSKIIDLNTELLIESKGPQRAEEKKKNWSEKPGWIVVTAVKNEDPLRQQEDYASCCCSIHNISLFLWQYGIGVKWSTGPVTRDPRLIQLLGADPNLEYCVGLLWYGYPDQDPAQTRKPLPDVLTRLP